MRHFLRSLSLPLCQYLIHLAVCVCVCVTLKMPSAHAKMFFIIWLKNTSQLTLAQGGRTGFVPRSPNCCCQWRRPSSHSFLASARVNCHRRGTTHAPCSIEPPKNTTLNLSQRLYKHTERRGRESKREEETYICTYSIYTILTQSTTTTPSCKAEIDSECEKQKVTRFQKLEL